MKKAKVARRVFKSAQCPACGKFGLNPYDVGGARPLLTDDIYYYWCFECGHEMRMSRTRRAKCCCSSCGVKRVK